MKKIYQFLLLIGLFLTFIGCGKSSSNVKHYIDNPTNNEITIEINNEKILIPAKSGIFYEFSYGKNTLNYNENSINFIVKPSSLKPNVIVNPTLSNYIFYKSVYVNKNDARATEEFLEWLNKQTTAETELILDGVLTTLTVPFVTTNELFIEKNKYNWDYYLDEEIPEGLVLTNPIITGRNKSLGNDPNYQAGKFQTVKSKIFREEEFLKFLSNNGIENKISFTSKILNYENIERYKIPEIDLNTIACPEGKKAMIQAVSVFNKWLTLKGSESSKEWEKVNDLSRTVITNKLENECYKENDGDYTYKQQKSILTTVIFKITFLHFVPIE